VTHCPAALLPGLSVAVPAAALKIIPCISRVPFGGLSAVWPPSICSVVTRAGIRIRSDQFVTSAALLPVVHVSPENWKVVRPRGSQRGSRPHMTPGHRGALVLVTDIGPSTGEGTTPCPALPRPRRLPSAEGR
jgi:hypothetical protein